MSTQRFQGSPSAETDVAPAKKRHTPFVQRRGDGFTEFEAMGMVQLVRTRWREGWDLVAQLHNQQHPGHNRSGDSLKKKFSRLYRATVPPHGAKNHAVIALAHQVHREMIDGVTVSPEEAADEEAFQTEDRAPSIAAESDHSWVEVQEPTAATPLPVTAAVDVKEAVTTPVTAPEPARPTRRDWQSPVTRIHTEAAGIPISPEMVLPTTTEGLLTSVLKVILQSQHQRDLDREEDRARREEEREHRKKELELWRQEMERRRAEDREERAESRRRHEQLMQMMTMLAGKTDTTSERNADI